MEKMKEHLLFIRIELNTNTSCKIECFDNLKYIYKDTGFFKNNIIKIKTIEIPDKVTDKNIKVNSGYKPIFSSHFWVKYHIEKRRLNISSTQYKAIKYGNSFWDRIRKERVLQNKNLWNIQYIIGLFITLISFSI